MYNWSLLSVGFTIILKGLGFRFLKKSTGFGDLLMVAIWQVQLVGYCTVEFLFLVYEFIDNGTLDQHLHHIDRGTSYVWFLLSIALMLLKVFDWN
jgi:hypothetical protein